MPKIFKLLDFLSACFSLAQISAVRTTSLITIGAVFGYMFGCGGQPRDFPAIIGFIAILVCGVAELAHDLRLKKVVASMFVHVSYGIDATKIQDDHDNILPKIMGFVWNVLDNPKA